MQVKSSLSIAKLQYHSVPAQKYNPVSGFQLDSTIGSQSVTGWTNQQTVGTSKATVGRAPRFTLTCFCQFEWEIVILV